MKYRIIQNLISFSILFDLSDPFDAFIVLFCVFFHVFIVAVGVFVYTMYSPLPIDGDAVYGFVYTGYC